jgi:hypothetical protein
MIDNKNVFAKNKTISFNTTACRLIILIQFFLAANSWYFFYNSGNSLCTPRVFRIRIGFDRDLDPVFYHDLDPESQILVDQFGSGFFPALTLFTFPSLN